jgi:predicted dithiol-disulfide oxidoreductase (DUF899 family)
MDNHKIVSRQEWTAARKALLVKEKALLRAQDALAAERRALPWVKIEKEYVFEGADGKQTLADLFDGRSQLLLNHFMLGPDWEQGCLGCSFGADAMSGSLVHLVNHDVMVVAVSRAPYPKIRAFHERMGWPFKWVSSFDSDFNYDFHVSFTDEDKARGEAYYNYEMRRYMSDELPGLSAFIKDEAGEVFHTYSTFARGTDQTGSAYSLLDLMPKGRNEPAGGNLGAWVRRHDEYDEKTGASCCHS